MRRKVKKVGSRCLKGRGIILGGRFENWIYDLNGDETLNGFISAEGWEEAKLMNAWYEINKDTSVSAMISDESFVIRLMGIECDESGHYSSSRIKVVAKCDF